MTDNEIIKALECCNKPIRENSCTECVFYHSGKRSSNMLNAALDLIKRQKAEIESLKHRKTELQIRNQELQHEKSEAIKEFAERLKEHRYGELNNCISFSVGYLDNLVKEMTEVSE